MSAADKCFLDPNFIDFLVRRGRKFDDIVKQICTIRPLVTSVKALQEIVYRYHLMGETKLGYQHANLVRQSMTVLPVTDAEIKTQKELIHRFPGWSPRELLHVSVMKNNSLEKILCSPESMYYQIPDVNVENILSQIDSGV